MKRLSPFYPVPLPPEPSELPPSGFTAAAGEYAMRVREFYDRRAHWHRRFYRVTGVVVIFIGASLPVLVAPTYPGKQIVVSVAGTIVAALTGLRAFYRWDESWVVMRTTERAVTEAYWHWRAQLDGDCSNGAAETHRAATQALLARLGELQLREADTYFKDLSFPAGHRTD
ncbi:DUF4231 domain-containing protein [Actinocrinis sp.]|uniref:DUF4231 domain-containing protein n=1 Tax=Actinocrinis sp. TaxID=1920516 RepID=UPI002D395276|nr:DUF4231 domain-containing protein [Actinocrinis sp.]HZP54790.1 DUF4231 domain-containing protein [Actinocrinis sp.]